MNAPLNTESAECRSLRSAADELRATVNGCGADPRLVADPEFKLAVANLLYRLAEDRELNPYIPQHFDDAALDVARALGFPPAQDGAR